MKTLLLILLLTVCAYGQDTKEQSATVYIYQTPHARMLKRAAPEVFCDGKLLAELDGGRYFAVVLPPGEYGFHSKNKKNGGVQLTVKADQTLLPTSRDGAHRVFSEVLRYQSNAT